MYLFLCTSAICTTGAIFKTNRKSHSIYVILIKLLSLTI